MAVYTFLCPDTVGQSKEISNLGVVHLVSVDGINPRCNLYCESVPAEGVRIVLIEIVLGVFARAGTVLNDVLILVTDDDGKVVVLFDSLFRDGFDGPLAAVTVFCEERIDGVGIEVIGVGKPLPPVTAHRDHPSRHTGVIVPQPHTTAPTCCTHTCSATSIKTVPDRQHEGGSCHCPLQSGALRRLSCIQIFYHALCSLKPMDSESHARIQLHTPTPGDERRVLDEYLLDAVQRFRARGDCEQVVYIRTGHSPSVEGGRLVLDLYGDVGSLVDEERERWDALVDDGPVTEWDRPDYDFFEHISGELGQDAARQHERLRAVATAMSPAMFEVLDERPDPVDFGSEHPELPVGWHRVFHILSNQWGYRIEDEAAAAAEHTEMTVRILESTQNATAAAECAGKLAGMFAALRTELETQDDEAGDGRQATLEEDSD